MQGKNNELNTSKIPNGVMLNGYPDSIGERLSDTIRMLKMTEFKDVFSLFYVLPTFFNSDLDRGFSVIDYNLNKELVSERDLKELKALNIILKFDIVLNHLSVASPQFQDLLKNGEQSKYKDFFINWNIFWQNKGEVNEGGVVIPKEEFLNKLFMRKSGLPILKVRFPDGSGTQEEHRTDPGGPGAGGPFPGGGRGGAADGVRRGGTGRIDGWGRGR